MVLNKSDLMQSPAVAKQQLVKYMSQYVPLVGHGGIVHSRREILPRLSCRRFKEEEQTQFSLQH